jgi:hypothetical protein
MKDRLLSVRRPSPALVVASIALLVALSGTSYAAITLPRDSVGTFQIRAGAVTSPKVRDASLGLADLSAGARRALKGQTGPQGPVGPKGDKGDAGPVGIAGLQLVTATSELDSSTDKSVLATCPENKRLISGGAAVWRTALKGVPAGVALAVSESVGVGWYAIAHETVSTDEAWFIRATATCATVN